MTNPDPTNAGMGQNPLDPNASGVPPQQATNKEDDNIVIRAPSNIQSAVEKAVTMAGGSVVGKVPAQMIVTRESPVIVSAPASADGVAPTTTDMPTPTTSVPSAEIAPASPIEEPKKEEGAKEEPKSEPAQSQETPPTTPTEPEKALPTSELLGTTSPTPQPPPEEPKKEEGAKEEPKNEPAQPQETPPMTPTEPEKALPSSDLSAPVDSLWGSAFGAKAIGVDLGKSGTSSADVVEVEMKDDPNAIKKKEFAKKKAEEEKKARNVVYKIKKPPRKKNKFLQSLNYMGMGKYRYLIIQNLALMLKAGLPLIEALRTLDTETKNKGVKKLMHGLIEKVENGQAFWRAMDEEGFFSPQAVALVRVGEEAGNLAENVARLATQQDKDQALKSKIKIAMIYPGLVITLMIGIVLALGLFVLPNIISVLTSLNAKLPLPTIILIAFTNYFSSHSAIILESVAIGIVVFMVLIRLKPFAMLAQWIVFHTPGIGQLLYESAIAQFGMTMGNLLQAGVPLVDGLRSLVDVTTTYSYKSFYKKLLDRISTGDSFSKCFSKIRGSDRLLPVSVQQLIMTGERTGSLSKIMMSISEIYERKANETADRLPIILEPMILMGIGVMVGGIAFAIIIPIYSVVGNMSGGSAP